LHSKTVVIDGVWSAIGSSNFDHRSVIYNDEVDAVVLAARRRRRWKICSRPARPIPGRSNPGLEVRPLAAAKGALRAGWENLL